MGADKLKGKLWVQGRICSTEKPLLMHAQQID